MIKDMTNMLDLLLKEDQDMPEDGKCYWCSCNSRLLTSCDSAPVATWYNLSKNRLLVCEEHLNVIKYLWDYEIIDGVYYHTSMDELEIEPSEDNDGI